MRFFRGMELDRCIDEDTNPMGAIGNEDDATVAVELCGCDIAVTTSLLGDFVDIGC